MPGIRVSESRRGFFRIAPVLGLLALVSLPQSAAASEPSALIDVLFVSNGHSPEEEDIHQHLIELGVYTVSVLKASKIKEGTDLEPFDLIIITGFSHNISWKGLLNIELSGKPVLIVEPYGFEYSRDLGLVGTNDCSAVDTATVELVGGESDLTLYVGRDAGIYDVQTSVCGVSTWDLAEGVMPLAYSSEQLDEFAVFTDRSRLITATSLAATEWYTPTAWRMFDILLNQLRPVGPPWQDQMEALAGLAESGLISYIDHLSRTTPPEEVRETAWRMVFRNNLHVLKWYINDELSKRDRGYSLMVPMPIPIQSHPKHGDYDDLRWFLGEYDVFAPEDYSGPAPPEHGDVVAGSDLGISTVFYSDTVFYMGDTYPPTMTKTAVIECESEDPVQNVCHFYSPFGPPIVPEINDAIIKAAPDNLPNDGVNTVVEEDGPQPFQSVSIDGVHRNVLWAQSGIDTWDEPTAPFVIDESAPNCIAPYEGERRSRNFSIPTGTLTHQPAYETFRFFRIQPC